MEPTVIAGEYEGEIKPVLKELEVKREFSPTLDAAKNRT
jgi:hypothetical protein